MGSIVGINPDRLVSSLLPSERNSVIDRTQRAANQIPTLDCDNWRSRLATRLCSWLQPIWNFFRSLFYSREVEPFVRADESEEAYLERLKDVAHVFDIPDQIVGENKCESYVTEDADWAGQIALMFANLPKHLSDMISESVRKETREIFLKTSEYLRVPDYEATAQSIREGKLVILPYGYNGHSMTLGFYNGYFFYCDRQEVAQFTIYKIDEKAVTGEELKTLNNYRNLSKNEAMAAIDTWVGPIDQKDYSHPVLSLFLIPRQEVGNCTYAGMEASLIAVLALKGILNVEPFLQHFRLKKLEDYLEHVPQKKIDDHVISHVRPKLADIPIDPSLFPKSAELAQGG
jgi:hypothetical protein